MAKVLPADWLLQKLRKQKFEHYFEETKSYKELPIMIVCTTYVWISDFTEIIGTILNDLFNFGIKQILI